MKSFGVALVALMALAPAATAAETWRKPASSYFKGTWSFDGTCASGDGMTLQDDGTAGFDEWGTGLWAEADGGRRLVLILKASEYDEHAGAMIVKELKVGTAAENTLTGTFENGRKIEAVRCREE